jgi:hypothetical protein
MSSSRSWARFAALALLFALAAWFAFEFASKPKPSERGDSAETKRDTASETPEAPNLQLVERQAAAEVVGDSEAGSSAVATLPGSGRVVDDLFGAPLQACVRPDVGPAVFSDGESGVFALDERHRGAARLRVKEVGFEALDVDAAPAFQENGVKLRLKSSRAAALYVEHSDGRPAEGVSVTWRALDPRTVARPSRERATSEVRVAAAAHERFTDSNGVAELALGVAAQVELRDPRAPDGVQLVQLVPGEQRTVVLGPLVTLRFVDFVSREPLPGFEVDAWAVREFGSLARALVADSNGVVRLAWSSAPLLLRLPGARAYEAELRPLSPGADRTGYGAEYLTMLRIDEPPRDPDGEFLVGVRRCGQRLRLVDAATREPVETDVVVETVNVEACNVRGAEQPGRCTWASPRARGTRLDSVQRSTGGVLDLSCGLYAPGGGPKTANPTLELVVLAAGYAPKRFTAPSTPPGELEAPLELELERVPQRWLRVEHANGRPFRLAVDVYAPSVDVLLWSSSGRPDGLHGPFDALDGDVIALGTRIPAAAWAISDTHTLRVPDATGAIEIVGAPPGVSLGAFVARMPPDGGRTEFAPTSLTADGCRFEALPASSYLVGPREWARAAELHSVNSGKIGESLKARAVRVAVPPGETVRVPWVSCWAAGRELSGRVTWRGAARPDLRLVPYYACGGGEGPEQARGAPWFPFGRSTPHLPLDRNGAYRIGADDPLPWLLAVCVADEAAWGSSQGLQVVESIRPGESVELSFATLILRWDGAASEKPKVVGYEIAAEALRHPLSTAYRVRRRTWTTATPLTLEFVPTRTTELAIHGRKLVLEPLEPGEVREIAVKFDALPPLEPGKH